MRTGMVRNLVRSAWLLAFSSLVLPSTARAVDKNTAEIRVHNSTGKEIEWVQVAHKYPRNKDYKHTRKWENLPHGFQTIDGMIVEFETGFGSIGTNWWIVTWKYKGDDAIYMTDPKNGQKLVNDIESLLEKVGGVGGGVVGAAVGGTAGAKYGAAVGETLSRLVNSESTDGFKAHMLKPIDSREKGAKPTIIEIKPVGSDSVKFWSPSGKSDTDAVGKKASPSPSKVPASLPKF